MEKRRHRRASPRIPARCTLIDHPASITIGHPVVMARMLDISATGIGLAFPGLLGCGTRLRIEFDTEVGRHVTMFAKVVRVEVTGREIKKLINHGLTYITKPEDFVDYSPELD